MARQEAYVAVVTGGGSGIGRALCVALAERRSTVLVADVDEEGAEATVEQVRKLGATAEAQRCDVREPEQLEALARRAEREFGSVGLLVNNAGVMVGGALDEIPIADMRLSVDVNLWGPLHGCRAFLPGMKARRRGKILNVASIAGVISPPETAPYNLTKAAVISLSETLSAELGPWNIDVTALCPSAVRTPLLDRMRTSNPAQIKLAKKGLFGPGREPEQVARFALAAVDEGRLYAFPHADARASWAAKRLSPSGFTALFRRLRGSGLIERAVGAKPGPR